MEQLGIDPVMILVQIVNFALLLFVMKKFLYKPVLSAIQKRKQALEEIAEGKDKVEKQQKDIAEEETKVRAQIQHEKEELLEEARREAQTEKRKIIDQANENAKEILKNADQQAQRVVEQARDQMQEAATEIAANMVKKVFAQIMDQEKKEQSIDSAIKRLEEMEKQNV